jgi:hypothetical protein
MIKLLFHEPAYGCGSVQHPKPDPATAGTPAEDIPNPNSDQFLLDAKSEVAEVGQEKERTDVPLKVMAVERDEWE